MSDDRPINRRRFFREGLRELLKPLAGAMEPLAEAAKQLGDLDMSTPAPAPTRTWPVQPHRDWVRPPGARTEYDFLAMCSRCAACVRVCPVQAIRIDSTGENGNGAPYIDIDSMPCTVCDGLLCMYNCPSGALQPVGREGIRMGLAIWHEETCLRSRGDACSLCVDKCPLGATAIRLNEGKVQVEPGCTGCGVCQHECPTWPKSILITPQVALQRDGRLGP